MQNILHFLLPNICITPAPKFPSHGSGCRSAGVEVTYDALSVILWHGGETTALKLSGSEFSSHSAISWYTNELLVLWYQLVVKDFGEKPALFDYEKHRYIDETKMNLDSSYLTEWDGRTETFWKSLEGLNLILQHHEWPTGAEDWRTVNLLFHV